MALAIWSHTCLIGYISGEFAVLSSKHFFYPSSTMWRSIVILKIKIITKLVTHGLNDIFFGVYTYAYIPVMIRSIKISGVRGPVQCIPPKHDCLPEMFLRTKVLTLVVPVCLELSLPFPSGCHIPGQIFFHREKRDAKSQLLRSFLHSNRATLC